ncbi:MAG TPA: hypothetical protein VFV60_01670 [bacterium]|nr:hypothetical protein [bacterium]
MFAIGLTNNQGFPWIRVTSFGEEVLRQQRFLPYDPDGFVGRVQQDLRLDDITLRYLREAVDGYSRNLPLSSSVMLGVASESLMLQLVEAFAGWREIDRTKFEDAVRGRTISEVYKAFRKRLENKVDLLPPELEPLACGCGGLDPVITEAGEWLNTSATR